MVEMLRMIPPLSEMLATEEIRQAKERFVRDADQAPA